MADPCQSFPELFFSDRRTDQKAAAALCVGCPARWDCLQAGLQEEHGVWGGLTELDRKQMHPEEYRAAQEAAEAQSERLDVEALADRARRGLAVPAAPAVPPPHGLDSRVVELTLAGASATDIADELAISRREVVRTRAARKGDLADRPPTNLANTKYRKDLQRNQALVAQMTKKGMAAEAIAKELKLSERTVKRYRKRAREMEAA
ncbi:WhiB family transcriptional regulator [Plantactinospora sp. WMMB782]|uniref:WhiB family transcriptional regulator n=1 Tax=Plantactinospora sp. WMMB782 TaxID=3404121 RepID=UPI003B957932